MAQLYGLLVSVLALIVTSVDHDRLMFEGVMTLGPVNGLQIASAIGFLIALAWSVMSLCLYPSVVEEEQEAEGRENIEVNHEQPSRASDDEVVKGNRRIWLD